MKVLVVKLTSMGDVLHLMPALTDLKRRHPQVQVDWMVEDSFAEIPAWHASVQRVIKVSTRRWRSLRWANVREFFAFLRELRAERYDLVIDAQGLMKSAVFARFAKLTADGYRAGFSGDSIKESPAAKLYQKKIKVQRQQHAVARLRKLFAGVFDYPPPSEEVDYQLAFARAEGSASILLLHGTTWQSKHLPEPMWGELADLIAEDGYQVKLCWGSLAERKRAELLAAERPHVSVLPKSSLSQLAKEISGVSGVIAVDTGLGHLAAGLGVPTVSIYGSTDAALTGAVGQNQIHIQSDYPCSPCLLKQCSKLTDQVTEPPCYRRLSLATIWQSLYEQIV